MLSRHICFMNYYHHNNQRNNSNRLRIEEFVSLLPSGMICGVNFDSIINVPWQYACIKNYKFTKLTLATCCLPFIFHNWEKISVTAQLTGKVST